MTQQQPQGEVRPGQRVPPEDFPTGPDIGEQVPDFTLPDQHGQPVTFSEALEGHQALLVFHRSARWWPFCRTQLVQLQQALPRFEAAGIRVFAVSYDSVEVLAGFAREQGITYPLLSDEGSEVIRRFGILNTLIEAHEGDRYGIPFPGSYVVDEDGRVAEKLFYRIYRTRLAAQSVLKDAFGVDLDVTLHPRAEVEAEGIRLSAVLGSETLINTQRVPLYVRLDLDPGLHVYAPPVPDGFVATEVELTLPEGVQAEAPGYPEAHPFRVEGIDADFLAMNGRVEIAIPLISEVSDQESINIGVTVRYQACTDRECYLPREEHLEIAVPVTGLNRPAPAG